MLTDYHVHLRPDDTDATPARHFTVGNVEKYLRAATEAGITELGVSEHIHRFTAALDIWQHPFWRMFAVDDVDAYCQFVREETELKLGIEADFVPGKDDRIANFLDAREWDYILGSVHFLLDRSIDMRGEWDVWGAGESAERIWTCYFETLAEAARSGLYDIMAHPDLVKIWGSSGPPPETDLRRYYEPVVEAFLEGNVAAEVSTAGLRKPVGEIYPARQFLEVIAEAGVPVALSSDAHLPEQVGFRYDEAIALLKDVGITHLAVFKERTRTLEPID